MTICYQGAPTETAAATVGAFLAERFPETCELLVEYEGEAFSGQAAYQSLPLKPGAELNVFRLVSGG